MQAIQLAEAGIVLRTHGVDGRLHLLANCTIQELSQGEALFLWLKGEKVPYFILEAENIGDKEWLIRLEDIADREFARHFTHHPFWLKESLLQPSDPEQSWIGWTIHDENGVEVGDIRHTTDMGEYLLFTVWHNGKEVLVPVPDDLLISVSETEQRMDVRIPEGLLHLDD
jgi:16S rRNA processing protein RimM